MSKGQESIKRLHRAFNSDKYVLDLRKRMTDVIAYSAVPFAGGEPDGFKYLKATLDYYTKEWWGGLLEPEKTHCSDLVYALRWSLIAHQDQKLLSTKSKSNKSVLECIDIRLELYIRWQREWLDSTNFENNANSALRTLEVFGWMPINSTPPFYTFTQWLYIKGWEALLSDREFLNAIRYFDDID